MSDKAMSSRGRSQYYERPDGVRIYAPEFVTFHTENEPYRIFVVGGHDSPWHGILVAENVGDGVRGQFRYYRAAAYERKLHPGFAAFHEAIKHVVEEGTPDSLAQDKESLKRLLASSFKRLVDRVDTGVLR